MDALQLAGFAVCAALLSLVLRHVRPEAGIMLALSAGVLTMLLVLPALSALMSGITALADLGGLPDTYMKSLLKVAGVALLMDFAAQTCRDAREDGLALKVEFAGRVLLLSLSLPFVRTLLSHILSLPLS